jgi:esterase
MKLFFREYGQGRPMIILHGLFGMSDNWVTIAKIFAEKLHFRVIIPDQRNHGKSGHHPVFNYHAMVDDLAGLYEELSVDTALLLGHSMGGKVAMRFALDYPANVERLIVADISPVTYKTYRHAFLLEVMSGLDFGKFKTKKDVEAEMLKQVPDQRLVHFMLKNVQNISRNKMGWKMNIDALKLNLEEVFRFHHVGKMFSKPVLWLKGENSDYIQSEHHLQMYSLFPETTLKIIPDASHWLHAENPDAFTKEIIDWIKA